MRYSGLIRLLASCSTTSSQLVGCSGWVGHCHCLIELPLMEAQCFRSAHFELPVAAGTVVENVLQHTVIQ